MNNVTQIKLRRPTREQRVDTIVESARKIFCSYGFEKGSIVDIANDAGIAEGTLYRYFDGKRSLLDEVLRRHYETIFYDIQQTLPSIKGHGNRLRYLIRHPTCYLIRSWNVRSDYREIRQFDDCQARKSLIVKPQS